MMEKAIKNDRIAESVNYMLECLPEELKLAATFYLNEEGSEKVHCDNVTDCYVISEETKTDIGENEEDAHNDMLVIEYIDWDLGTRSMAVIPKKNIHRYILYHYNPKSGKKIAHVL